MIFCFRYFGTCLVFILLFHVLFLVFYDSQSSNDIPYDVNSLSSSSSDYVEHISRINHLNSTLTLLNHELRNINYTIHQFPLITRETPKVYSSTPNILSSTLLVKQPKVKTAILFTMDSISSYEDAAHHGGAAGEIIIRHSLETAFQYFNVKLDIMRSDSEFEKKELRLYDIIILDPWTWAAKGWVPKPNIKGIDNKVYILDFFGSEKLRGSGLKIPPSRFLTAFGSPWNSFLGYFINELPVTVTKKRQGVLWGKDSKHFDGKENIIHTASELSPLLATIASTHSNLRSNNIQWIGHQNRNEWNTILAESKFLLGLGNPVLGPSAIDAITHGCVYINPVYEKPVRDIFTSQHPYAEKMIGSPYVCSYHINNMKELRGCIENALRIELKPFLPNDFQKQVYFERVAKIFNL